MNIIDILENSKLFEATESKINSAGNAEYHSHYRGNTLSSSFQAIVSVPHRRIVGYEALVRAESEYGETVSPAMLFSLPETSEEHLHLDRALRSLHIHNFSNRPEGNSWLFLNLDSASLSTIKPHQGFMASLFSISGIKPQQVVIEILESEIKDTVYLQELIEHFRRLGCLIAIDDFGAGHSNFDRIWKLNPDIVKMDRSLITRAVNSAKVKRVLARMVSLIQEAGCLVVMEGLENKQETLTAIEVGADLLQGYYFGKPSKTFANEQQVEPLVAELVEIEGGELKRHSQELDKHFLRFKHQFDQALKKFIKTADLASAADIIFSEPRAVRCFILDKNGYQIGDSVHAKHYEQALDERFLPLLSGQNACWVHKPYHYRAISQPNKLQLTRPYISVAGLHMCITVSKAIKIDGRLLVFCCDLEWKDN